MSASEPTPTGAPGTIDLTAAIEAGAKAVPVDPDDGTAIIGYHADGIPLWSLPSIVAQKVIEAAAPVLFRQWVAEVFVPVVSEHKHPADSCPCCRMAEAAEQLLARGSRPADSGEAS